MTMFQQSSSSESIEEPQESDMFLMAAAASVLLSQFEFFMNDNPERGVFIGLWPPTILAFAIYLRVRMKEN